MCRCLMTWWDFLVDSDLKNPIFISGLSIVNSIDMVIPIERSSNQT